MIRIVIYLEGGQEQSSHDCLTVQDAFERLERANMRAMAYPLASTSGAYIWRPNSHHTLESFADKMLRIEVGS